jgi:hypothetical protein
MPEMPTGLPVEDPDRTLPPAAPLRMRAALDLFAGMPRLAGLIGPAPEAGESVADFARRLERSATPEDALVLAAFALRPEPAIRWARALLPGPAGPDEAAMLGLVDAWLAADHPRERERHAAMRLALFAPVAGPAVHLGLAVGWSGGSYAPNDPSAVPAFRAPRAVAAAVAGALAGVPVSGRAQWVGQALDRAVLLFGTA